MSEIDLKGATIKGVFIAPEGVTTVKNGIFASYDEGHLYKEEFDGMSLESADRSFTTGRTAAEQEAWVESQEPETETRYEYKYNFTTGESSYKTEEVEVVTVTLLVPEQSFQTTYPKDEWDAAVATDDVEDLTDWWRSDIDSEIESHFLGPDGAQLW